MPIGRDNSLRTVTLNDGVQLAIVAGRGKTVAVEMGTGEIESIRRMPAADRQRTLERIAGEGWQKTKGRLGYCSRQKMDVEVLECVRCANTRRGMRSIAAWEMCVRQSVLKDTGKGESQ